MLDSSIQAYVDTRKVFLGQGNISGQLSLARLPRFVECLADDVGSVSVELIFALNDAGQRLISGHLQAQVNVLCQRCLNPLAIELTDEIRLALLKDEEAVRQLDPALDPWFCEGHKLDLAELVEEQLILCMPIVSYHDSSACIDRRNYVSGESNESAANLLENPFNVLKSLKESDITD